MSITRFISLAKLEESYNEMVENDLELLWYLLQYIQKPPKRYAPYVKWLHRNVLKKAVSKYPWQDIVSIIWILFALGVIFLRSKHVWPVMINLGFCAALRLILEAKRPVEYDVRLQPLTDTGAESYGFPSLESYMSIVIFGHQFMYNRSLMYLLLSGILTFIIGLSRIYSRSRFPHQIVGSWILGFFGLIIGTNMCERIRFHELKALHHNFLLGAVIAMFLVSFAFAVENNDSRWFYIPKAEFIRVMSLIINGQTNDINKDSNLEYSSLPLDEDDYDETFMDGRSNSRSKGTNKNDRNIGLISSPRSTKIRQAQSISMKLKERHLDMRRKGERIKSDSLYFLQKSMMQREEHWRQKMKGNKSSGKSAVQSRIIKRSVYEEIDKDEVDSVNSDRYVYDRIA